MGLLSRTSKKTLTPVADGQPPTAQEQSPAPITGYSTMPKNQVDEGWVAKAKAGAGDRGSMTNMIKQQNADLTDTQMKTFLRWWQAELPKTEDAPTITDLPADIADGVAPIMLVRMITGKRIKYNPKPRDLHQRIENQTTFFKKLQELGVKLVGIGPEDIADGTKTTLVLGLTYTLICHFGGISEAGSKELFAWMKQNVDTELLDVKKSPAESLKDGKVLCALLRGTASPGDVPTQPARRIALFTRTACPSIASTAASTPCSTACTCCIAA